MVLAAILVFLHLTLHVGLGIGTAAPDLFTLALLLVARDAHTAVATGMGLVLGLLEDALGLLAFGAHGIAMAVVGFLAARTRDLFVGDSLLFVASYLFLGKWVRDAVYWVAVGSDLRPAWFQALILDAGYASAYVAAVGLVLVLVTGTLQGSGRGRS